MSKNNNRNLVKANCTNKEDIKNAGLNEQIEQQSVQQRYQTELVKYQEQINKTKQLSKNHQAA